MERNQLRRKARGALAWTGTAIFVLVVAALIIAAIKFVVDNGYDEFAYVFIAVAYVVGMAIAGWMNN